MKAIQFKSAIVALFIIIGSTIANAQDQRTCTVIDVNGGVYFDRTWLFTVPGTSQAFDNGWDSYKFLTTGSAVPQIYVIGTDGNFQVGTVGNANNTVIGFIPGEATEYTLTFTHTDLAYSYQQLYLYDKVTDQTIDIYAQGSTYSFTSSPADVKERFIILTSIASTDNGSDTGTTTPDDSTVTPDNGSGTDTGNDSGTQVKDKNKNDKKDKKDCKENKAKKVKSYCYGKKIHIKNPNKQKGHIKIVNSKNGKVVKEVIVPAETTTTVDTNSGTYVIITTVEADVNSENVMAN